MFFGHVEYVIAFSFVKNQVTVCSKLPRPTGEHCNNSYISFSGLSVVHKTENEAEAMFGQSIYKKREFHICVPRSKTDIEIEKKYGEQGNFHSIWML